MTQHKIYRLISRSRKLMISRKDRAVRDTLLYWQQTIFVYMLLIILLLGPFAVASGSLLFYREGNLLMAGAVLLYYLFFCSLAFLKPLGYKRRLVLLGWSLYTVGITLIITTGPYGAGLLYLCIAFVYLALNASRKSSFLQVILNGLVFLLLTLIYNTGQLDTFPIADYKQIWVIIVINIILVNIFITQMIGLVLRGMERQFIREKRINRTLRRIQNESAKQIRLLKSLRQTGNCLSDTRLNFSERLQFFHNNLREDLPVKTSAIVLTDREDLSSAYLSSQPEDLSGRKAEIPLFSGPYLMFDSSGRHEYPGKTAVLGQQEKDDIYFGSHFYSPDRKGFLELLLQKKPDSVELEYLQMNLFQLSGAITNEQLISQLKNSYDEVLMAWARILELRDIETKGHSLRVAAISMRMAELLGLPEDDRIYLRRGAFLHDIGKLGIPDSILHKPSSLDTAEWEIMKKHPDHGREAVMNIPFLSRSLPVIYSHHERWDGSGYPDGLKEEEIPFNARIFILADIYDALVSDRPYRKAMEQEEIISIMSSEKGKIFDPELLDLFIKNINEVTSRREIDGIPVE